MGELIPRARYCVDRMGVLMPIEVVDMLKDGHDELRRVVEKLQETMSREHRELAEKVTKLESQHRFMMWAGAPICIAIGAVVRDVVGRWF